MLATHSKDVELGRDLQQASHDFLVFFCKKPFLVVRYLPKRFTVCLVCFLKIQKHSIEYMMI